MSDGAYGCLRVLTGICGCLRVSTGMCWSPLVSVVTYRCLKVSFTV